MDILKSCTSIDITPGEDNKCLTYEDVASKKNKLFLIQAPANFDMNRLEGEQILLDGQQDLAADENTDKGKRYAVKSKTNCRKNMKSCSILLPSREDGALKLARSLHGSINIVQSIYVPPVTLPEKEDLVLPEISERRKHKWKPYGSEYPLQSETPRQKHASPKRSAKSDGEPNLKRKKLKDKEGVSDCNKFLVGSPKKSKKSKKSKT
eukprot:gene5958-6651_t